MKETISYAYVLCVDTNKLLFIEPTLQQTVQEYCINAHPLFNE